MPTEKPWEVYDAWREAYGDIIYLDALGQGILIVNKLEDAVELLARRAPSYSDRWPTPVISLTESNWIFSFLNYGTTWREHRGLFHRSINQTQVHRYDYMSEEELKNLLPRLLADPADFRELLRAALACIIMRVAYGSKDYEHNKRLAFSAKEVLHGILNNSEPTVMLVNLLHSLRFVPSWTPGAGWKRQLRAVAAHSRAVINEPYDEVRKRIISGAQVDASALAVQFIQKLPEESDLTFQAEDTIARNVAAVAFLGGADTSISSALAMVLGLTMKPHAQRRAQQELDAVVGLGQLPTSKDIPRLPYIQAIVKETGRWHSVTPLSVPHISTQSDTYKGHHIPAGTAVMPNTWAIMHDPAVFELPFEFIPERYLKDGQIDPSVLDPEASAFGFGRRICPGRHFSNANLKLLAATLLSCFNFEQVLGEDGEPLPLELSGPSGTLMTPAPFPCRFVPRSQLHVDLIRSCRS